MKRHFTILLILAIVCMYGSNVFAQSSKTYDPSKEYKIYKAKKHSYCLEMANLDCLSINDNYYKVFTRGTKSMDTFVNECTAKDWGTVCDMKCRYQKECRYKDDSRVYDICYNECKAVLKPLYESTPEFAELKEQERQAQERHAAEIAEKQRQAEIARIQQAERAASALRRQQELQAAELEEKKKNDEMVRIQQAEIDKANMEYQQKKLIVESKQEIERLIRLDDITSQNECTCRCLNSSTTLTKIRDLASLYNGTNPDTSSLHFLHCLTKAHVFGFSSKQVDQIFDGYRESEQTHFLLCESICSEVMPKATAKKTSIKNMISNTLR